MHIILPPSWHAVKPWRLLLLALAGSRCWAELIAVSGLSVGGAAAPNSVVVTRFGADAGGRIEATLSTNPPAASVVVSYFQEALWDGINHLQQNPDGTTGFCHAPAAVRWTLNGSSVSALGLVPSRDVYVLVVQRCEGDTVGVSGAFTLTNGGAEFPHLPLNYLGLPSIYTNLSVLYAAVVVWWAVLLATRRPLVWWLQVVYGGVGACKAVACALEAAAWRAPTPSPSLRGGAGVLDTTATMGFLGVNLLLAFGWSAAAGRSAEHRELTLLGFLLGGYALVGATHAVCEGGSGGAQCASLEVIQLVLFSIACLLIVVLLNYQIGSLRFALSEQEWTPAVPTKYGMLATYSGLRLAFGGLLVSLPVASLVRVAMVDWAHEWVVVGMQEAAALVAAVAVGAQLAPRLTRGVDVVLDAVEQQEATRDAVRRRGGGGGGGLGVGPRRRGNSESRRTAPAPRRSSESLRSRHSDGGGGASNDGRAGLGRQ